MLILDTALMQAKQDFPMFEWEGIPEAQGFILVCNIYKWTILEFSYTDSNNKFECRFYPLGSKTYFIQEADLVKAVRRALIYKARLVASSSSNLARQLIGFIK